MDKKVERIHVEKKKKYDSVKVNQDYVNELVAQAKKSKSNKADATVETLVTDDRFKSMFEDIEFKRSRQEADFKEVMKGKDKHNDDMESEVSDNSEEEKKPVKAPLNALFAGKGDGDEQAQSEDDEDFAAKMDKKERKKYKKDRSKDKIGTKDARVLTGGLTSSESAAVKKLESKLSAKSKKIKKNAGTNEITKESVLNKLKNRRLAIP